MTWKSYIYPQTIARFTSPYNKDIRVVEEHGKNKILVNGSPQSGPYIEMLWRQALGSFKIHKTMRPSSILILGIAGGTVIHLLHSWYSKAAITAVDIDKTMISIGKKYFGLSTIKNLTIRNADAEKFVSLHHKQYDIIIVDMSFGRIIPQFITSKKFLSDIKELVSENGVIVINFLREKEYRGKSEDLKWMLKDLFDSVAEKAIFLNRFFVVK